MMTSFAQDKASCTSQNSQEFQFMFWFMSQSRENGNFHAWWKCTSQRGLVTITLFKSQWIKPSSAALRVEETMNQIESQQIKSNIGFC